MERWIQGGQVWCLWHRFPRTSLGDWAIFKKVKEKYFHTHWKSRYFPFSREHLLLNLYKIPFYWEICVTAVFTNIRDWKEDKSLYELKIYFYRENKFFLSIKWDFTVTSMTHIDSHTQKAQNPTTSSPRRTLELLSFLILNRCSLC